jgi:hypothetical protein
MAPRRITDEKDFSTRRKTTYVAGQVGGMRETRTDGSKRQCSVDVEFFTTQHVRDETIKLRIILRDIKRWSRTRSLPLSASEMERKKKNGDFYENAGYTRNRTANDVRTGRKPLQSAGSESSSRLRLVEIINRSSFNDGHTDIAQAQ